MTTRYTVNPETVPAKTVTHSQLRPTRDGGHVAYDYCDCHATTDHAWGEDIQEASAPALPAYVVERSAVPSDRMTVPLFHVVMVTANGRVHITSKYTRPEAVYVALELERADALAAEMNAARTARYATA